MEKDEGGIGASKRSLEDKALLLKTPLVVWYWVAIKKKSQSSKS
jgi:hypothetical protein